MNSPIGPATVEISKAKLDFLWLEITAKCNLECIHCYADSSPILPLHEKVTFEEWCQALSEAAELGCQKVQFIGGEPTLYPRLIELIEHAKANKYLLIEVYTNGTNLTPALMQCVVDNKVHLAFSLYADDSSIHDEITNRPGSFDKTIDSIKWATQSKVPVRVGIIEMSLNNGLAERTKAMLHELGVDNVGIDRVRGIGRGTRLQYTESEKDDFQYLQLCGQCSQGKLCVTASGAIFPCVFSRFYTVGTIKAGLAKAVTSLEIRKFRERLTNVMESSSLGCSPSPSCNPDHPPDPKCNPDSRCRPEDYCQPETTQPCSPNMGVNEPESEPDDDSEK
jgi:MoaA/NifB/PqqE/SkfB family radical SAM enzyme